MYSLYLLGMQVFIKNCLNSYSNTFLQNNTCSFKLKHFCTIAVKYCTVVNSHDMCTVDGENIIHQWIRTYFCFILRITLILFNLPW